MGTPCAGINIGHAFSIKYRFIILILICVTVIKFYNMNFSGHNDWSEGFSDPLWGLIIAVDESNKILIFLWSLNMKEILTTLVKMHTVFVSYVIFN